MAILSAQQKGGFSYIEKAAGSRYQSRCDVRETDGNRDKTGTRNLAHPPTHAANGPTVRKNKKIEI